MVHTLHDDLLGSLADLAIEQPLQRQSRAVTVVQVCRASRMSAYSQNEIIALHQKQGILAHCDAVGWEPSTASQADIRAFRCKHPGSSAKLLGLPHLSWGCPVSEEGVERRLTATLAADVVAYRRPTIDDEAGIRGALNTSCEEPTDSRSGEADPDSLFRRSHPTGRRFSHLLRPQLSIPCRAIAAAIVLLGLSATIAAADPGITAAEIRQTAQDVLSRASYQRELPHERVGSESRETGTPPRTEFETGEPDDAKPAPPERLDDRLEPPEGLGDVARSLLWVLVLVGGALLVFYLLNEVPLLVKQSRDRRDQRTSLKPRSATDELARPSDGGLLDEADRLARQGKYGEAIHVLLLNSLEDLHRRLDVALAPSLTSREILRTVSLTEDAKSALARIVSLAELNHFGGRASSEAEYQTCRENYRRLATVGSEAA